MATIHMILQGKGGVGKSLIASILAQHLLEDEKEVFCVDTDPVNATFAGYKRFNVTALDIMKEDDIDPRSFDKLSEMMAELPDNSHMVIDNGAATFVPLASYLAENEVFDLLKGRGHSINLHSVITGGQALPDTLSGLNSLLNAFQDIPIYVWLNGYFGQISNEGKNFEEFKIYQNNIERFAALIKLPQKKKETFGKDLENILSSRLSFQEAIQGETPLMMKQRLHMMWREIRAELKQCGV
ncbi:MAG: conjugal transfer protein TraL [Desulfovibrio sp. S3730MH75]|nr:MAG: conjugal transfer protein TraL [Desulfovibrio sp. S3730MH75]